MVGGVTFALFIDKLGIPLKTMIIVLYALEALIILFFLVRLCSTIFCLMVAHCATFCHILPHFTPHFASFCLILPYFRWRSTYLMSLAVPRTISSTGRFSQRVSRRGSLTLGSARFRTS